ncbi:RNA polymerase-binding protein RbpA [Actinokineospora sp. 24-640]
MYARGPLRSLRPAPDIGAQRTSPTEAPAPQTQVSYRCPLPYDGHPSHEFTRAFSAEKGVSPPEFWTCPRHGVESRRAQSTGPDTRRVKRQRTHWDMLRERRTIPELNALLTERLAALCEQRDPGASTAN